MIRTLAIIVILFGLNGVSFADSVEPNHRVSNSLNVRDNPSSESTIIGSLRPGQSLPYIQSVPYYHEVDLGGGRSGFVSKGFSRIIRISTPSASSGTLKLHFIDVGQGDSTLVECPDGSHILIDAGSTGDYPGEEVRDYLLGVLIDHDLVINDLIVTHPDRDHYNRLPELLNGFVVNRLHWTGSLEDYLVESSKHWLFDTLETERIHLGDGYHDPHTVASTSLTCGAADVFVLSAGLAKGRTSWLKNTSSIVIMLRFGDFEAVLTGDATTVTEDEILSNYPAEWLDIDLLKVGHHGSRTTSTSDLWANTLSPEVAIVSAGPSNSHGHPSQDVIDRLEPHTVSSANHTITAASGTRGNYQWHPQDNYVEAIYNTTTSGTLVVTSDGSGWQVEMEGL